MLRRPLLLAFLLLSACPDTPVELPAPCPEGTLDEGGACIPDRCGRAPWGTVEPDPTEATWYVSAEAVAGGDGSAGAPFGTLGAAMEAAAASPGGRIVVGAGHYAERLSFSRAHDGLEIQGRCRDLVVIDGSGLAAATLSVFASRIVVRSLTITGGRPGIIAGEVPGAPGLVLRGNDLWVEDNGGYGILATGSGVLADFAECTVTGVRPTNLVSPARGIGVANGAQLIGVGLRVEAIQGIGLQVEGADTRAEIDGLTLRDGLSQDDGTLGRGAHVRDGGELIVRTATIAGMPEHAMVIEGSTSALDLTDASLSCGGPQWCARVFAGGALAALRTRWEVSGGAGLSIHGGGSFADLADVQVAGAAAPAWAVEAGGALLARGGTIEGAAQGVFAAGAGSLLSLTNIDLRATTGASVVVVDDASLEADDLGVIEAGGPGLLATRQGSIECTACLVDGARFAGAAAISGGRLQLAGGAIRATLEHPSAGGGVGVFGAGAGTILQVDDTTVSGHPHAGIVVQGAGTWRIARAIIEDSGGGGLGPGLLARGGTSWWLPPAGPGLYVFANRFAQLPNDALLLDGATGTIAGNVFEQVGQLELYTQNCATVSPPEVAEQLETNECAGPPRDLGPPLAWPEPPDAASP